MSTQDRVARGAALLDQAVPGWAERVNLFALDMGSTCKDVLGQLWADKAETDDPYEEALAALFPGVDPCEHGFDIGPRYAETTTFPALTFEWKRVIIGRRGGAS